MPPTPVSMTMEGTTTMERRSRKERRRVKQRKTRDQMQIEVVPNAPAHSVAQAQVDVQLGQVARRDAHNWKRQKGGEAKSDEAESVLISKRAARKRKK